MIRCTAPHFFRIKTRASSQKRDDHLHGEERLVGVGRVLLEESCEELEVGAWGVEPIELACALRVVGTERARRI